MNQQAHPALPLQRSTHRQIIAADGGLVCEVFSGALGIEGADAMEVFIVRACNTHDDLVMALRDLIAWMPGRGAWHTDAPTQAVERARDVIAKAKA